MSAIQRTRLGGGFTLLEMLISVMLLGILLSAVQPAPAGIADAQVRAAAAEVEAALRFARDESLVTGNVYGVYFDVEQDRIRVFRGDPTTDPPTPVFDVLHPLDRRPWDVSLRTRIATAHVDLAQVSNWYGACTAPTFVIFRDAGTPACGQPLETLLTDATYTLTKNGVTRSVKLDGLTGRVYEP